MDRRKVSATGGARTPKQRVHTGPARGQKQPMQPGAKPRPSKDINGPKVAVDIHPNLPVQRIQKLENGRDLQPSANATVLVETSLAETLSLSMHNAIINQQNSQMTTAASVTNACARLLQVPFPTMSEELTEVASESDEVDIVDSEEEDADYEVVRVSKKKKIMNIFNLMRPGKRSKKEADLIEVIDVTEDNANSEHKEGAEESTTSTENKPNSGEKPHE